MLIQLGPVLNCKLVQTQTHHAPKADPYVHPPATVGHLYQFCLHQYVWVIDLCQAPLPSHQNNFYHSQTLRKHYKCHNIALWMSHKKCRNSTLASSCPIILLFVCMRSVKPQNLLANTTQNIPDMVSPQPTTRRQGVIRQAF